jgi:hypothetical protein
MLAIVVAKPHFLCCNALADRLRKSTIQHRELASDAFDSVFEPDGIALGEVSGEEQDAADDSLQVSQCEDDEDEMAAQMESIDSLFPEESTLVTDTLAVSSRRESVVAPPTAPSAFAAPEDGDEDCNPAALNAPSECYTDVLASSAVKPGSASKAARKRKASETSEGKASQKVMQLTIPNTPNLRVLKRTRSERIMSSTSLELQKIREEREAMKKQKAKFDKTYTHVKSVVAAPTAVPRSVKPLTQVCELMNCQACLLAPI